MIVLKDTPLFVLMALSSLASDGHVTATVKTLRGLTNRRRYTVQKALRRLEELGLIERTYASKGGRASQYRLTGVPFTHDLPPALRALAHMEAAA